MKISYNWLQSYFSKKLPRPEKLAEFLTMHSFEVEGLKKVGKDCVFDIDVLPNRAHDCLSHAGVAREVAVLINSKLQNPNYKQIPNSKFKIQNFLKVEVKDLDLCQRYTAKVMTGVKVGSSPAWLRERLEALGQKPINNVVDATNYVMFELGQPLHAFDFEKIKSMENEKGKMKKVKILIRRAKKGEKIITLDGEERILDASMLVIADSEKPIAIAGIMGGVETEVDSGTTGLILESARFDPASTRKSSRKLGVRTESSLRFEAGIDPNLASVAQERLAVLIQELAGGGAVGGMIDIYPKKTYPKKVLLNLDNLDRLLGVEVGEREVLRILSSLSFRPKRKKPRTYLVDIPTFRQDIEIEEDIIEEVGRIYGYERIPSLLPALELVARRGDSNPGPPRLTRRLLEGLGYSETYSVSFVGAELLEKTGFATEDHLVIENPVSEEYVYLRGSLLPNLLSSAVSNIKHHARGIKFFELGKTYVKSGVRPRETIMLGLVSAGEENREGFYVIKGELEWIFERIGLSDAHFANINLLASRNTFWHPRNSAEIHVGEKRIGTVGEISPLVLENLGITGTKAYSAEIDYEALVDLAQVDARYYEPISRYPATLRDVAVLVPVEIRVEEVLNVINRAGGELVKDVDLFDMYEGEELPDGKKNLAFHIVYQTDTRTLMSYEVDKLHSEIGRALEEEIGAEIRTS